MRVLLLVVVVLALAAGAGAWWISGRGFSAREKPNRLEEALALRLRGLATPRGARERRNPLPASPENVRAGMEHFADHCAICHGNDGSGDTEFGRGLYPKPPDLREARTRGLTDGELFYIIENGVRLTGMPAFGGGPGSDPNETWQLVTFIRHLPRITREELARMEELNPKSAEQLRQEREEEEFLKGGRPPHRH